MTFPVVLQTDAETEIEEATIWYEQRRTGLGLEFVAALDRSMLDIGENPKRFPVWTPPWRRAILRRFPFVIFFEVEKNQVVIMAVAHAKRRPGYWVARRPPRTQYR